MKKISLYLSILLLSVLNKNAQAQVCNAAGDLMIFTNYDGGTLTINVDQPIANLKIGVCSYEAVRIVLTGAFVGNVIAVRYAGYNDVNNSGCGSPAIPTTTIIGAPGTATTSIVSSPTSPLSNSFGWPNIICGYSCVNNSSQGGCNTPDQIEAYFLGYFSGSTLFAHRIQYNCWTGTQSVSAGGNCCPPIPVIPGGISASQTICAGQTPAAFTSTAAATGGSGTITYTWQSSTTSASSGFSNISSANALTYAPGALSTTTYYRRAASTATNNVSYSNVIAITVNPLPNISVSGPSGICPGGSITLQATGASAYTWTPGPITSNQLTLAAAGAGSYTVLGISSNGCTNTAVRQVSVHLAPSITVGGNTVICAGATGTLYGSGAVSYTWGPVVGYGSTYTVSPTITSLFSVTGVDLNTCTATANFVVQVNPNPTLNIAIASTTICLGKSLTITPLGATTYTLLPGNIVANSFTLTPTSSSSYTLLGQSINGCINTKTFTVNVSPLPVISTTVVTQPVCSGRATVLTATGAVTYSWMPGPLLGPTVSILPQTSVIYTVTGMSQFFCESTTTVALNVIPSPTVTVTASKAQLCTGESSKLTASGANTFTWNTGTATVPSASIQVNPISSTVYSVVGSNGNGCDTDVFFSVLVTACTGLDQAKSLDLVEIFPNPNKGEFQLRSPQPASLYLYSINGSLMRELELNTKNNNQVIVKDLAPGVYFIKSANQQWQKKIVVEK